MANPQPKCWICGALAGSAEHKIKRSDLRHRYGNDAFKETGGLLHVVLDKLTPIQGPGATDSCVI